MQKIQMIAIGVFMGFVVAMASGGLSAVRAQQQSPSTHVPSSVLTSRPLTATTGRRQLLTSGVTVDATRMLGEHAWYPTSTAPTQGRPDVGVRTASNGTSLTATACEIHTA